MRGDIQVFLQGISLDRDDLDLHAGVDRIGLGFDRIHRKIDVLRGRGIEGEFIELPGGLIVIAEHDGIHTSQDIVRRGDHDLLDRIAVFQLEILERQAAITGQMGIGNLGVRDEGVIDDALSVESHRLGVGRTCERSLHRRDVQTALALFDLPASPFSLNARRSVGEILITGCALDLGHFRRKFGVCPTFGEDGLARGLYKYGTGGRVAFIDRGQRKLDLVALRPEDGIGSFGDGAELRLGVEAGAHVNLNLVFR